MYALYHQPRPDDATLELLVTDWTELLDDLTEAEFVQGMKAAKRVCRFLPVPADVLKAVEDQRRKPAHTHCVALPCDMPSEEDLERNRRRAREYLSKIREGIQASTGGPVRASFGTAAESAEVRQ